MKTLILHVSDIHLKNQKNMASDRLKLVPQAVRNVEVDVNTVVVVVSGDIAFSGDPDEYAIATEDWSWLIQQLKEEFGSASVHFIAVPGNHDCNLRSNQSVRDIILGKVREENATFDEQVILTCAEAQKDFRTFLKGMQSPNPKPGSNTAYYDYEIQAGENTLLFRCYNTALTSTNPERPAQLTYPFSFMGQNEPQGKYDYVVSVFHHPYNWLMPNIGRRLREHVERTSDLILTGHEHESSNYRKYSYTSDGENDYLEGAVFQEKDEPENSGFNAVWIDMTAQQQKLRSYTWSGTIYQPQENDHWLPWSKGGRLVRKDFQITAEFEAELEDPGAKFEHYARPGGLRLEDIYVFPAVRELSVEGKQQSSPQPRIEGRELLKRLMGMGRILIIGRERSGKSTLAKILFHEFYRKGAVPVMLEGEDITLKTLELEAFEKLVTTKLQAQYKNPKLPLFEQLGKEETVIILDDFDHAKVNPKGRLKLLDTIQKRFNRICVFSDSFIQIEELAYGDLGTTVLENYHQLELQEFGHFLRSKIIEQWYALGSEYASNPEEIDRKIDAACSLIDSFLDKSYLPAYPIFILTFLQAIDTAQPLNTNAGSYGHIYEVLVTKALANTGDKKINIDTKANYLAEMAYWLFEHQTKELSDTEYRLFHSKFEEKYTIRLPSEHLFELLRGSGILAGGGQEFRFKYPYYHYYFVARYFRDNIQQPKVRDQIKGLLAKLQIEDHSNIWIILTHLSKDPFLVDSIIEHAKRLFNEIVPSEFGRDIEFLKEFYALIPKIVLEDKTPGEMREIRRQQLEEHHQSNQELLKEENKGEEVISLITKLNAAFRTIEVLGQIVRNFPGSIVGDTKYQLVKECYDLGLRVMAFILDMWKDGREDIVAQVVDLILDKNPTLESKAELTKKIKAFLFTFLELVAFNMVKRISNAVGATALAETYEKVVEARPTKAIKLINVSVKLDTIAFPKKELVSLYREFAENIFCQEVLRHLVVHHFYLFHTDYKIKQSICDEMGIEFKAVNRVELSRMETKRIKN
jgi:DNA repair exonuclease SbcCD nuclease subunit